MKEKLRNYRETFDRLLPEINENIEKYRKGTFTNIAEKTVIEIKNNK